MSDFHFLIVSVDAKSDMREAIQEKLDAAKDWIRPWPHVWLVWTSVSASRWYERLKPTLNKGDHIFVCKLDIDDRGGLMPQGVWDFVRSKTNNSFSLE